MLVTLQPPSTLTVLPAFALPATLQPLPTLAACPIEF